MAYHNTEQNKNYLLKPIFWLKIDIAKIFARGVRFLKIIKKIAKILNLFSLDTTELGISEISRETGIPKGTVHRILVALEEESLLKQGENQLYYPGEKLFWIGKVAEENMNIIKVATPFLKKLSTKHKCAAHLAYLDGTAVVYLDKQVASSFFEFASRVGMRIPAHATALGKSMLAYQQETFVREQFQNFTFEKFTPHTIANLEELIRELKKSRQWGYALDNEEISLGLNCVAAPIFNYSGQVEAAISLAKPLSQIDEDEKRRMVTSVVEATLAVSKKLGYQTSTPKGGDLR